MSKDEYAELLKDPRWRAKRLEILRRDKHTCVKCGAKTKLHVHHKVYSSNYPWESTNNELITLCKTCHEKVHNIKAQKTNIGVPKINYDKYFWLTDEFLKKHLKVNSEEIYKKFITKCLKKGIIIYTRGLLDKKIQVFYIEGHIKYSTRKKFENRILEVFQQFIKEDLKQLIQ